LVEVCIVEGLIILLKNDGRDLGYNNNDKKERREER